MELIPFTGTRSNYACLSRGKRPNSVYCGDETRIIRGEQEHSERSPQLLAPCGVLLGGGGRRSLLACPGWCQHPGLWPERGSTSSLSALSSSWGSPWAWRSQTQKLALELSGATSQPLVLAGTHGRVLGRQQSIPQVWGCWGEVGAQNSPGFMRNHLVSGIVSDMGMGPWTLGV